MVTYASSESPGLLFRIRSIVDFYAAAGVACLLLLILLFLPSVVSSAPRIKLKQDGSLQTLVDRGRYMVKVAGCNDCHTPGYNESGGQLPEHDWLTGTEVGFAGPWGTTYPTNLRLYFDSLTDSEWRVRAHTPMRPPMPSPSLMSMTDDDLDAIYTYVRHLGPTGVPAPAYVPPGGLVSTPILDFVPHTQ